MKKMDTYPPLKAIALTDKKLPHIREKIEASRIAMLQEGEQLPREDIYIPEWRVHDDVLLDGSYNVPSEYYLRHLSVTIAALASWRQYKEVYRFAPEMETILYEQADCDIPMEVLLYLPFPCFYVETPQLCDQKYHGFLVSLDQAEQGEQRVLLHCIAIKKEDTLDFKLFEIPFLPGKTLKEGIFDAVTFVRDEIPSAKGKELLIAFAEDHAQYRLEVISRLCQLILYVTAQNADIKEQQPGRSGSRSPGKNIKDKYREIRNWDVGYRIVNKLVNTEQSEKRPQEAEKSEREDEASSKTRTSPMPHLRRGHWHTYWTGKRNAKDRKMILKWIPLTQINCTSVKELPVTINQYK
ncbi:MAG: hypothetical protein LBT06_17145 [Hungatella sp.]|jgi:hypothetical protein|nr:hypothetical protein [Hungatella sp.]